MNSKRISPFDRNTLTPKEAARVLSEGLGWPVRAGDVKDAVKLGRLRVEKDPEGRRRYLVPEEEVLRLIDENRGNRASQDARRRAEESQARIWDSLPRRSWDFLWRVEWKRRPKDPKPADPSATEVDEATDRLANDLARLEERRSRKK